MGQFGCDFQISFSAYEKHNKSWFKGIFYTWQFYQIHWFHIKYELSGKSCGLIQVAIVKEWIYYVLAGLLVYFFPSFIVCVDGKIENIHLAWELLLVTSSKGMTYFTIVLFYFIDKTALLWNISV